MERPAVQRGARSVRRGGSGSGGDAASSREAPP